MDIGLHLDEDEIERYSLGVTAELDLPDVEEHLLICPRCQERVASSDLYVKSMRTAAAAMPLPETAAPRRWRLPRFAFAFAAAAILLGAILLPQRQTTPVTVPLSAMRGPGVNVTAPARTPLALQLDVAGLPAAPSYRVEMVDHLGRPVWTGSFPGAIAKPAPAGI